MGGSEMEILKLLLPFLIRVKRRPCSERAQKIRREHQDVRMRIAMMEESLLSASMNGEERWFLTPHKADDGKEPRNG